MKRLLLRIGALGTVVVLGVIAIAQAQRGADHPPAASGSAAGGTSLSSEAVPRPLPSPGSAGANPLRSPIRQVAATEELPAAVAAADSARPGATMPPAQLVPKVGADPFGLRAAGKGSSPGAVGSGTAASTDEVVPTPPEMLPDASNTSAPPRPLVMEKPRDPPTNKAAAAGRGYAPAKAPPSADRYPAERYPTTARGGDRYTAAAPAANDPAEPAPLQADPFSMPSSMPSMPAGVSRQAVAAPESSAWPPAVQGTARPQAAATALDRGGFPDASALEAASTGEGTGKPGGKQLEGPQSPHLTIQKFAPEEIQVGKPASVRVVVHNTGNVAASGVEVHDPIPKGTRVISTQPRASRGVQGELVWTLGTVKPGEESAVEVQLLPLCEGEIGSVATVIFNADASARSKATKPQLVLETSAPERALLGSEITLSITISNPGSGAATGVVLEEHIPAGLQHAGGSNLEYEVGELPPGANRKLELTLVASRPGPVTNILTARGDGSLQAESRRNLEITAPQLDVAFEGPKKRYLEREATYQLSVSNPGTAPAEQVELVAYLPAGLKFISANNGGHYDEASRAVHWQLEELPVNEIGTVELVTLPVEAGQQAIKLQGTAQKGLKVEKEQPVLIEGIAAILFQVADTADPIEVGGETTYEIHVANQGSKAATNVRVALTLPPEMKLVAAEGPTRNAADGNRVIFDGLARLAPKADTTYRVRAQGLRPGDLRTCIQLMSDEMQSPVTKEESTRVYADE